MGKQVWRSRSKPTIDLDTNLLVDPDVEVVFSKEDKHRFREEIDVVLVILVGGFLGTLCRYELSSHWIQSGSSFPLAIFTVNVTGSLLIGVVLTTIIEKMAPTRYLRPLTCIGFLGGWTTMSTLAIESDHLISSNHLGVAMAYIFATMIATPVVAAFGISLAHRLPGVQPSAERTRSP